jgi:hypothetical protein
MDLLTAKAATFRIFRSPVGPFTPVHEDNFTTGTGDSMEDRGGVAGLHFVVSSLIRGQCAFARS